MTRCIKLLCVLVVMVILLAGCAVSDNTQDTDVPTVGPTITVDFSTVTGEYKSLLNGINNGPKSHAQIQGNAIAWNLDATQIYKDLEIPYVRTHDTEYPGGSDNFIDIHCIFPDMSKDPEDEDAYNFSGTDAYISNIRASGAQVYYRLGESIAPSVKEATYQYPPEDYNKWAEICEHIIAHYNDGWNNGFEYNIQYWEIWNEPDIERQWVGDIEEYYELYKVAARHLKAAFPDVKIGGGVLASAEEDRIKAFLEGINDDGKRTPLDFFSWHLYTNEPFRFIYRGNLARKLLDEYGYTDAQTFCDEWNYVDDWENIETTWEKIQSSDMAAYYAASLMSLQNCAVDGAMYYDGALTGEYAAWCGLYTAEGKILPGYYGFWAFNQIKNLKNQVDVSAQRNTAEAGLYVCAATGVSDAILIANLNDNSIRFQLNSNSKKTKADIFIVNGDNPTGQQLTGEEFAGERIMEMKPFEMQYIVLN